MCKCHFLKEGKLVFKPGLAVRISGCLHNIGFFKASMMPRGGVFCMQIANYIMLKMLYKEKMKTGFSFFFFFPVSSSTSLVLWLQLTFTEHLLCLRCFYIIENLWQWFRRCRIIWFLWMRNLGLWEFKWPSHPIRKRYCSLLYTRASQTRAHIRILGRACYKLCGGAREGAFPTIPKWCCCCWSGDPTLKSTVLQHVTSLTRWP